jgi:hypothetical protein
VYKKGSPDRLAAALRQAGRREVEVEVEVKIRKLLTSEIKAWNVAGMRPTDGTFSLHSRGSALTFHRPGGKTLEGLALGVDTAVTIALHFW